MDPAFKNCKDNFESCIGIIIKTALKGICGKTRRGLWWCYRLEGLPDAMVAVNEEEKVGLIFMWGRRVLGFFLKKDGALEVTSNLYYGTWEN